MLGGARRAAAAVPKRQSARGGGAEETRAVTPGSGSMQLITGLVLASCLLVQADSEAFFLPGLLSRSSPRPRPRHPANTFRAPRLADPGAKMKLDFGGWKPINFDEQLPAKMKLDFGGWKPINFD